MKRALLAAVLLMALLPLQAQKKSKKKKAEDPPPVEAPQLKNAVDSFSYAIGISIMGFYKGQNVDTVDMPSLIWAIEDMMKDQPQLDETTANQVMIEYINSMNARKAQANREAGEKFLEENSKKAGVTTLPSGLQYEVLVTGTGPKPGATDKVKVHYIGTLIDGKEFDNSHKRGEPLDLRVNGVIKGWTEALQLMPAGSKWKLYIPSALAYGERQAGPDISPGSALIFEVELIEIVP